MEENKDKRSLGDLFSIFLEKMSKMIRLEIELAKSEITKKTTRLFRDVVFLIAGVVVGFIGLLTLVGAAVAALWLVLPLWLSALIVGVIVCGIGISFIQKGISALKHGSLKPEHTIETLKEGKEWAKEQI